MPLKLNRWNAVVGIALVAFLFAIMVLHKGESGRSSQQVVYPEQIKFNYPPDSIESVLADSNGEVYSYVDPAGGRWNKGPNNVWTRLYGDGNVDEFSSKWTGRVRIDDKYNVWLTNESEWSQTVFYNDGSVVTRTATSASVHYPNGMDRQFDLEGSKVLRWVEYRDDGMFVWRRSDGGKFREFVYSEHDDGKPTGDFINADQLSFDDDGTFWTDYGGHMKIAHLRTGAVVRMGSHDLAKSDSKPQP
ncbi:MAG TPA: hypothetical protein V6D17_02845 [Candidatus Obscuribacterales bacterium]